MKPVQNLIKRMAVTTLVLSTLFIAIAPVATAQTVSEIKAVVNRQAITNQDINRRVNFLRLQSQSGNLQEKARDELVEEAIKMQEATRFRTVASDEEVDAAFARFARGNNMSPEQMTRILGQSGIGVDHFKSFIRVQMSWPRLVTRRYSSGSSGGGMSTQELVSKMMERGGEKPVTTEYILQQVIFVVPQSRRSAILEARRREAEAMRVRFESCDTTRDFARTLRDVSVRELGRIMQPQLPPEWKEAIESAEIGDTTPVRATDRGIEFIAICEAKQVSDDLAAEMVFRAEGEASEVNEENAKEFLAELRERAMIEYR